MDTPADFTSPEELYKDLIAAIKKYHPSTDLSDICLLYTSDAADEEDSVDLGGRRNLKKKKNNKRRKKMNNR